MLTDIILDAELKDTTLRKVIADYHRAELQRMEPYLGVLEAEHPELKRYIDVSRNVDDPIENLMALRDQAMHFLDRTRNIGSIDMAVLDGRAVDPIIIKLVEMREAFGQYLGIVSEAFRFYRNIAEAVRTIASRRSLDINSVLNNERYCAEALREVFPDRVSVEEYHKSKFAAERKFVSLLNGITEISRVLGDTRPVEFLLCEGELELLNEALVQYRKGVFDLAYGV